MRRQFAYGRFLDRVFSHDPDRWVLKGATGLLARIPGQARHSMDIDLFFAGRIEAAIGALRDVVQVDRGDFFTFDIERGSRPFRSDGGEHAAVRRLSRGQDLRSISRGCGRDSYDDDRTRRFAMLATEQWRFRTSGAGECATSWVHGGGGWSQRTCGFLTATGSLPLGLQSRINDGWHTIHLFGRQYRWMVYHTHYESEYPARVGGRRCSGTAA
ncbi:MAG: hypothetical protein DRJ50_09215 [Actinobacteria bacterium]|nr:MAG: hypothetical protein DRJ50_09215 [Actinomycetota bacterium]